MKHLSTFAAFVILLLLFAAAPSQPSQYTVEVRCAEAVTHINTSKNNGWMVHSITAFAMNETPRYCIIVYTR